MILYSPSIVAPATVPTMASQIDLAPTIMRSLGLDDGGRFFGQDLLGPAVRERAWLGNYQEIGHADTGRERRWRPGGAFTGAAHRPSTAIDPDGSERPGSRSKRGKPSRRSPDYQLAETTSLQSRALPG